MDDGGFGRGETEGSVSRRLGPHIRSQSCQAERAQRVERARGSPLQFGCHVQGWEVDAEAGGDTMGRVLGSCENHIHLHFFFFQHLQPHPFSGVFLSSFTCFPVSDLENKTFEPMVTPY